MGWPGGSYRSYGPKRLSYYDAFKLEHDLKSRYLGQWYRWVWNGQAWVVDTLTGPQLLARA